MPKSARSFADDLRARSDEQLRVLLAARPDLTRPAPGDLTSLAARAATRGSVQRALDVLSADELRVLEAVLVGGADAAPQLLSTTKRAVQAAGRVLWDRALLWRSPEGYRPARAVSEILSTPARLGPPARELGAPDRSADAVVSYENLSGAARSAIDRLLWRHPRASFTGSSATGVLDELIAAGLIVHTEDGGVIPREVGLALRGGRLYADGITPPAQPTQRLVARDVDADAAGAALDILWRVDALVRLWDQSPPRVLRSGGLSVRDHRAAASALDADLELAAFVIELAYTARLIANDGDFEPSWLPTTAYDDWVDTDTASRWATIATAWLDSSRAPSLAGTSTEQGTINVLSTEVAWPMMRSRRRDVLDILATVDQSVSVPTEYIESMLHWQRPMRLPAGAPTRADEVLREAAWLGVTGRGVLSAPGRALLAGDGGAATAMAAALPAPVDHLLLQADLTAVAPGPLTEELNSLMQAAADVESRGGATVYRFTDRSIRRALDTGRSASELIEQLTVASPTPVPQPLDYLISDVARRHGQTRVGTASCYLRNDDTAMLDAMAGDRNLSALQLRKIAPTVVISPAHPTTVLEMLRQHGYSPVAEGQDGHVVHVGSDHTRAPAPRVSEPPRLDAVTDEVVEQVIAHVRRGEQESAGRAAQSAGPRIPSTDPTVTLAMLQDAASEQAAVWIGYTDTDGALHRTLFRPHRADGGRVTGMVGDGSQSRTFSIHRITGVAPA